MAVQGSPTRQVPGSPTGQVPSLWWLRQASRSHMAPRPLLLLSWGLILTPSQARACAVHRGWGSSRGLSSWSLSYPPVATSWLGGHLRFQLPGGPGGSPPRVNALLWALPRPAITHGPKPPTLGSCGQCSCCPGLGLTGRAWGTQCARQAAPASERGASVCPCPTPGMAGSKGTFQAYQSCRARWTTRPWRDPTQHIHHLPGRPSETSPAAQSGCSAVRGGLLAILTVFEGALVCTFPPQRLLYRDTQVVSGRRGGWGSQLSLPERPLHAPSMTPHPMGGAPLGTQKMLGSIRDAGPPSGGQGR